MLYNRIGTCNYFPDIITEVRELISKIKFNPVFGNQLSLQVRAGTVDNESSWWQSVGKITTPERTLLEDEFTTVHPALAGGSISRWIGELADMGIKRTRLMVTHPHHCYSIHRDPTPRIHFPIITNPGAHLCFPDSGVMCHLPADGGWWWVDTRHNHTAINGGTGARVHLVGVVDH